jgi:hypothetical protein
LRNFPRAFNLLTALVLIAWSANATAQNQAPRRVGRDAVAQIQSLRAEKQARTPRQRKISSRLLYESKQRRGRRIASQVRNLRTGVQVDSDGTTLVDIDAEVIPGVLHRIRQLGGRIVVAIPERKAIRAHLPIEQIEPLAEMAAVRKIRPAGRFMTNKVDTSAGDVAHRADDARSLFGLDGTGIGVGVLSDGVDTLAARQTTGDLPATVTVLPGQEGSGDEGTAILEIVFDLAPGADLFFATGFNGQASFASNILALRAAGADVIVDDVAYFAEAVFQDDDVADAVDTVFADGALYFSAAGNEGNLNDGTSGVWEGAFNLSGATYGIAADPAHDYDGSGTIMNEVTADSPFVFTLHWGEPLGESGDDYDLFLLSADGNDLLGASTDFQGGDDDPYEEIPSFGIDDTGSNLVITKTSGGPRYLHLSAVRGQLAFATEGHISGHTAALGALSIAAVNAGSANGPGGTFDGTEQVENYSSDGPRRIFYAADGTPFQPASSPPDELSGQPRAKPDLTAADCVDTSTPAYANFCGTSAAAPHAAAIAALLLEAGAGRNVTQSEVIAALKATALDLEPAGHDRDSGVGIIDGYAAAELIIPALGPIGLGVLVAAIAGAGIRRSRQIRRQ